MAASSNQITPCISSCCAGAAALAKPNSKIRGPLGASHPPYLEEVTPATSHVHVPLAEESQQPPGDNVNDGDTPSAV